MWSLVGTVPATVSFQPSSMALAARVRERTWFRVLVLVLTFVAVALVFLLVQTKLHQDSELGMARTRSSAVAPYPVATWWVATRAVVTSSFGPFLGVTLAGLVLAGVGPRWAVPCPALLFVGSSWLLDLVPGVEVGGGWYPASLQPIGLAWYPGSAPPVWRGAGFATTVDVLLALLPALATAWAFGSRGGRRRRHVIDAADVAAVGSATVAALVPLVLAPSVYHELDHGWDAVVLYLPFFVFGAALAMPRRRWWLGVGGVPLLVGAPWICQEWFHPRYPTNTGPLLAYAVAVFAGASIRPMATMWRRAMERPVTLLVACNVLNVADALLTAIGLDRGTVIESNPVIDRIGLLPKIAIVGIASALIYRARPRMLVWPTAVLAGVLVWHSVGYLAGNRFLWW